MDALIYGKHKDGRKILFPIEWKYVEAYGNEDKGCGEKGDTRKKRYTDLIKSSGQLKTGSDEAFYYEPFYQLMRQTIWAEQMVAHKDTETIKADDYIHIHVIPKDNKELLNKAYPYSGKGMEDTWRSLIREQSKYRIITPKDLLTPMDPVKNSSLIEYLSQRYW